MPLFTVLSRRDAFVDSVAIVEADDAQAAADLAYDGDLVWEERGVVQFDARRVVTLDAAGEEIDATARGERPVAPVICHPGRRSRPGTQGVRVRRG